MPRLKLSLPTLDAVGIITGLAIGVIGGLAFVWLKMPLPWMIGSAVFVSIAALCGVRVAPRMPGRDLMFAVLGVLMGAAIHPGTFANAESWVISLGAMVVFVVVVTAGVAAILMRCGYDRITAYFSSAPGGLSEMILMGGQAGGDDRVIALIHSIRITITVLVIGAWYRLVHGYQPNGNSSLGSVLDVTALDAGALIAMGIVGWLVGTRLRLPGGTFLGPMIASAAAHGFGLTKAVPPSEIISIAQLVVGTAIGCRFNGTSVHEFRKALGMGVVLAIALIAFAAAVAIPLAPMVGLPFEALLLAFAPGGLTEMSLISMTLGIDPAFVTTHHIFRLILILMIGPMVFRWLAAKGP